MDLSSVTQPLCDPRAARGILFQVIGEGKMVGQGEAVPLSNGIFGRSQLDLTRLFFVIEDCYVTVACLQDSLEENPCVSAEINSLASPFLPTEDNCNCFKGWEQRSRSWSAPINQTPIPNGRCCFQIYTGGLQSKRDIRPMIDPNR